MKSLWPQTPLVELRRARPLLGTIVDIQVAACTEQFASRALVRAFTAIERVQRKLSFHESTSELAQLNARAQREAVRVSSLTWALLQRMRTLARVSEGRFDAAVGRRSNIGCAAIRLEPGRRVRFPERMTLDLGGIAKGYAVDVAMASLRRSGVERAVINAGGDMRVWGAGAVPIHVRHPSQPGVFYPLGQLTEGALATSALTFSGRMKRGKIVGALVDPRTGAACGQGVSITVWARSAWLADGLTKVVACDPSSAGSVLARYRARAVVIDESGRALWVGMKEGFNCVA